jgi:hypothetical protein
VDDAALMSLSLRDRLTGRPLPRDTAATWRFDADAGR